jgi:putative ABC transport system substrate-binding protein
VIARREFLIALGAGAFAVPIHSLAQQPANIHRIGFLGSASAAGYARQVEALRAGLRELGYAENKNIIIEYRWADGEYTRLSGLATELVNLKVDVIVTCCTPGGLAAKRATTTIPIVVAFVGNAVASGLVDSLARPGGNLTGSSFFNPELVGKRLELLKEVSPHIKRVGILVNASNRGLTMTAMEIAAKTLKLDLKMFWGQEPNDFSSAFAAMAKARVDAIAINEDPVIIAHARAIGELAAKQRVPSIGFAEIGETGGLIGYGANFIEMYHRAAYFIDRILKGSKPSELPVEQPTKFELVINLKTAKALGISIPQSIMLRADKVIG